MDRPERRAARVLNFDLNEEPGPEPEEEQLPQNDAPEVLDPIPQPPASPRIRVIHDLEEEDSQVDVLFDISKIEQNELDMVVNSNKFARKGKYVEVQGAKKGDDGLISVRLRLRNMGERDRNNSSAEGSRRRKRARTRTTQTYDRDGSPGDEGSSSAKARCVTLKIKWKSQGMVGDVQVQRSSPEEQGNP